MPTHYHILDHYVPPTPADLANLKDRLAMTSHDMARLTYLSCGNNWRRYTSRASTRPLGALTHFYLAAQLTLSAEQLAQVYATMRSHGAALAVDAFEPLPERRRRAVDGS